MARQERRGFKPSKDAYRAKSAGGGGYDSYIKREFKKYKIKDGKNLVRVLPPTWDNADYHAVDVFVNYGIGPDNASYLSLSKHGKGRDPIAEARVQANKEGDDEVSKQLQPRERRVMWIIDRLDEDEGPQILDAPVTLDKAMAALSIDDDEDGIIDFTDPENGNDIRFNCDGKGLNRKYEAVKLMKPSPLTDDEKQLETWLSYTQENPVTDCLNFYDYDHISQVFNGSVAAKDTDDEDEKPKKRTSSRDDDDDDANSRKTSRKTDVEDADDEDERPRNTPRRQTTASKAVPPFDDDDEDETPRSRQRVKVQDDDENADDTADEGPKPGGLREKLRARKRHTDDD